MSWGRPVCWQRSIGALEPGWEEGVPHDGETLILSNQVGVT